MYEFDKNLASNTFVQRLQAECYDSHSVSETTKKTTTVWLKVFRKDMEDHIKFNAHSEWTAAEQARQHKVTNLHLPIDKFEDVKYIFLVYPVDSGLSFLKDQIAAKGILSEADVKVLAKFILSTLSNLHRSYLSPLQVSPSYILMQGSEYKIGGICSRYQRGVVIGDRRFAAPELRDLATHENKLSLDEGEKADIWSVGMVLLFAMTGAAPAFGADDNVNVDYVLRAHDVGNEAKLFIKLLVHNDPQQRPSVKQAIRHNWILST